MPVASSAGFCARALHYVDHANGVKDFDVWSFYAERADGPFPARWRGTADFGRSKFGRFPGDPPRYKGRRVDLIGRSLRVPLTADPADVLRSYLSAARTESARALAAKAVVLIVPSDRAGEVIWPDRLDHTRLQSATPPAAGHSP